MIRLGGGNRRSFRRRNYLPYQLVRQFQRDILIGLGMVVSSGILLLLLGAATKPFSIEIIEEGAFYSAQTDDGEKCRLYETFPYNYTAEPEAQATGDAQAAATETTRPPVRATVDCGDQSGVGIIGAVQYVAYAILGAGVVLVVSGGFAMLVSTRMSREMLVVPIGFLGIIGGIAAIVWGLSGDAPGLVFQGLRSQATTGLLRPGGALTEQDAAVAWGVGLVAASAMRLTRS